MNRIILFIFSITLYCNVVIAQKKLIDATDHSPISAASIFDSEGNMIGLTQIDGIFPKIPTSAYPITLRCIGYEQLTIENPEDSTWEMIPRIYDLNEIVVVPVKRNVLKQSFYVREYFSLNNEEDSATFFLEHMAVRFVPTTKDAKFGGNSSLHILNSRCYSRYKINEIDSVAVSNNSDFPSALTFCELEDSQIDASKFFKEQRSTAKLYQEVGKSGMALILKQNAQTFTSIEDMLAGKKSHRASPFFLKLIGMTMDINQMFITQTYRANDRYIYLPQDIMDASFVLEINGKGKLIRKIFKSDKPIIIRSMIELYLVDNEYLSNEEAKQEYKDKEINLKFNIPSTVPPLNVATQKLVTRAKAKN